MLHASRIALTTALVASMSTPSVAFAGETGLQLRRAEEPAEDDSQTRAREAFREGKKAFRLGKFEEAITKFEEAYGLTGNATVLFNIALAYERLGENKNDPQALRNARTTYQNYLGELLKSDLREMEASDADDKQGEIEAAIKKLDIRIETLEAEEEARREREAAAAAAAAAQQAGEERAAAESEQDRRDALMKKSKLWLGVGAGVGGVLTAAGAGLAAAFAVQGNTLTDDLTKATSDYVGGGCNPPSTPTASDCDQQWSNIQALRDDGKRANTMSLAVGVPVAVVGLAVVGLGVGLSLKYKKQARGMGTASEEAASVSLLPTSRGLVLSGRF